MLKPFIFIVAGFLMSFCTWARPLAAGTTDFTQVIIVVGAPESSNPGQPRMPAKVPFSAEQDGCFVYLGCQNTSYGTVTVTITSTAGDDYETSFNTSDGQILLPISGESGYYLLTIVTASGQVFYGEFYL